MNPLENMGPPHFLFWRPAFFSRLGVVFCCCCHPQTTNKSTVLRNYFVKSKYYESIGDFQKAHEYQTLEFDLYKIMFSEKQAVAIQTLQEQFESRLKEQQISDLTIDNKQKTSKMGQSDGNIVK